MKSLFFIVVITLSLGSNAETWSCYVKNSSGQTVVTGQVSSDDSSSSFSFFEDDMWYVARYTENNKLRLAMPLKVGSTNPADWVALYTDAVSPTQIELIHPLKNKTLGCLKKDLNRNH